MAPSVITGVEASKSNDFGVSLAGSSGRNPLVIAVKYRKCRSSPVNPRKTVGLASADWRIEVSSSGDKAQRKCRGSSLVLPASQKGWGKATPAAGTSSRKGGLE